MHRPSSTSSLVLAGLVLAGAWYGLMPAPEPGETASATPTAAPAIGGSQLATASFGNLSPFTALQSAPDPSRRSAPGGGTRREQLEQLLRDYHVAGMGTDEKHHIRQTLRELQQDPLGRALIIETFFSTNAPELAQSLYGLIRDADLKDVTLLEGLIQRASVTPLASATPRIMDLIADLNTQDKAPYSATIDSYLAQTAQHSDTALRSAAASQRIWYLAQHQPHNLAALKGYLIDTAPTVREEMYSLLESRMAQQALTGQTEFAQALGAALHADYLGVSTEEKARQTALLESLSGRSASL